MIWNDYHQNRQSLRVGSFRLDQWNWWIPGKRDARSHCNRCASDSELGCIGCWSVLRVRSSFIRWCQERSRIKRERARVNLQWTKVARHSDCSNIESAIISIAFNDSSSAGPWLTWVRVGGFCRSAEDDQTLKGNCGWRLFISSKFICRWCFLPWERSQIHLVMDKSDEIDWFMVSWPSPLVVSCPSLVSELYSFGVGVIVTQTAIKSYKKALRRSATCRSDRYCCSDFVDCDSRGFGRRVTQSSVVSIDARQNEESSLSVNSTFLSVVRISEFISTRRTLHEVVSCSSLDDATGIVPLSAYEDVVSFVICGCWRRFLFWRRDVSFQSLFSMFEFESRHVTSKSLMENLLTDTITLFCYEANLNRDVHHLTQLS